MLVFEYRYNSKKKKNAGIMGKGLVDFPAIEKSGVLHLRSERIHFNSDKQEEAPKTLFSKDSNLFTAPLMIPDIKIYRSAKSLGTDKLDPEDPNFKKDGYIFFTKDTVKRMFEDWMESDRINNNTENHEIEIDGCPLIEAWLVIDSEKDKSNALKIKQSVGTVMVTLKIHNDEIRDKINSGEITGLSIEADGLDRVQINASKDEEDLEVMSDDFIKMALDHLKSKGETIEQLKEQGWELIENPTPELIAEIEASSVKMGIDSTASQPSSLDRPTYQVRYAYKLKKEFQGEKFIIDTSRDFCKEVHAENKWYRLEDVEAATNPDFGTYDIRKYAGSYGCRHRWEKNYFSKSMKFAEEKEDISEDIYNLIIQKIDTYLVQPGPSETKEEFISRCIPIEINNGHPQDQAVAICESKWANKK